MVPGAPWCSRYLSPFWRGTFRVVGQIRLDATTMNAIDKDRLFPFSLLLRTSILQRRTGQFNSLALPKRYTPPHPPITPRKRLFAGLSMDETAVSRIPIWLSAALPCPLPGPVYPALKKGKREKSIPHAREREHYGTIRKGTCLQWAPPSEVKRARGASRQREKSSVKWLEGKEKTEKK